MSKIEVYNWKDLPSTPKVGGAMDRAGFRGDGAILTFNWIKPTMRRWVPHRHPFDQIVLTVEGTQILEVEGRAFACPPRSIMRIAGNDMHTGWPGDGKPVLNIDVFAPAREDYLPLVDWQEGFPARDKNKEVPVYQQNPSQVDFDGEWLESTAGIVYGWDDLPKTELLDGMMIRSAFRGDGCLVVFNECRPGMKRAEPHQHAFDQLVMVVEGRMILEVDGREHEMGPYSIARVPGGVPHTGWPIDGTSVLNIDVFAPARADYLDLVGYQKGFGAQP